jgi:O-antigen/teichoic acid export membrane protein
VTRPVDRLRRLIPADGPARAVAILASGSVLSQVALVLAAPVLTRLYKPADLGIYGAAVSIISLALVISSFRYERAIPLPEDRGQAASLIALSLVLAVLVTAAAGVILFFVGSAAARALNVPGLTPLLWLLPPALFAGAVAQVMSSWAVRAAAFYEIATVRIFQSTATVLAQVAAGLVGLVPAGLLVGDVIGRTIGTMQLARLLWRQEGIALRDVSLAAIRVAANRYRRFPIYAAGAALLDAIGLQVPVILLLAFYGPAIAGLYLLVNRIVGVPSGLLATSVAQVYVSEAARLADRPHEIEVIFLRTLRQLAMIGIGPIALVALVAPAVFPVFFGSEWQAAGLYLTILAPMYWLQFATSPMGSTLEVVERQDLSLLREVVRIVLIAGAIILAGMLQLEPIAAIALLSLGGSLGYLVYGWVSWYALVAARTDRRGSRTREPGATGPIDPPASEVEAEVVEDIARDGSP